MAVSTDSIGIIPNVLEQFVSFNAIFTISALTTEQLNFPEASNSYKNNQLGQIVLRSASGRPDSRIRTAYTTSDNPTGQYDFYIDNVNIESIISFDKKTKGSNATEITFEVLEPYSMGLFLQSLQLAAASVSDAGILATYTETPFLLTIQFMGYDSSGNLVAIDDKLDRHIPFTFTNIELDVAASGSRYKITAIPHNEEALKDSVNRVKEDIAISGLTVQELLQSGKNSLQYRLNTHRIEIAKQGSETNKPEYIPDQVAIIFPKSSVAGISAPGLGEDLGQPIKVEPDKVNANARVRERLTLSRQTSVTSSGSAANETESVTSSLVQDSASLNAIGAASMGFDANTGGESQPTEGNRAQSNPDKPVKRNANSYDPKNKVFRFPQGSSVINIITEVLLMSEFCKKAVEQPSDKNGLKTWFRIETQVFNLKPTPGNANRAKRPKLYVYKIVEYKVHEHRFKPPGAMPQGYEDLKKNCVKEYNYIYSGKNVDILNFNINLKTAMFTTAYSDMNALAGSVYGQLNGAATQPSAQPTNADSNKLSVDAGMTTPPTGELSKRYRNTGGGPNDDYRSLVAKNFQEALLNSPADMLTIEMDIMGDPYYLADSGMGNFSDIPQSYNINSNGTMNYQSGEVDILINFRTPLDYNSTGSMDFAEGTDATGFSGLYNVYEVSNKFSSGKFTQTLKAIRRPVQQPKAAEQIIKPVIDTPVISEQAAMLAAQEEGFDDAKPTSVDPNKAAPRKAIDSATQGSRTGQVEYVPATNTKVPGRD
jgi:hypothetical protein